MLLKAAQLMLCNMLQGQNCNCTKQEVANLVGLVLNDDSSVVTIDDTASSADANDNICQAAIPHGFISAPCTRSACLHACC